MMTGYNTEEKLLNSEYVYGLTKGFLIGVRHLERYEFLFECEPTYELITEISSDDPVYIIRLTVSNKERYQFIEFYRTTKIQNVDLLINSLKEEIKNFRKIFENINPNKVNI